MNESSESQPSAFETFNVYEDKQQDCLEADVPDVIPLTSSNVADLSIPTHSKKICNEDINEVERLNNNCEQLKKQLEEANKKVDLANKIILKSNISNNVLKKHIKRLTQMKNNSKTQHNYVKLKSSLKQIFNDDQIEALERRSSRGHKWSNDTIKKALRLKFSCGSSGYQELLKEKLPLPCERTLRRKLESIQFEEGICDDIFKLLQDKVAQFKDVREKDCSLVLDEMSIAPGQQFDPSTHLDQRSHGHGSCIYRGDELMISPFDPEKDDLMIDKWIKHVDELSAQYGCDGRAIMRLIPSRLKGHAHQWYDTRPQLAVTWAETKEELTQQFRKVSAKLVPLLQKSEILLIVPLI
ncbi:PREDICTED: uncharacterized protein LOC108762480 [Trachymyrmex cornetzi]|uniref:uncharacterized protein LOC108762480 n=1 Tax=Trachymyrmex cornetzi TaxID=471704 RepID=UPI00084F3C43|nr:PREDICTED: uncharacterized protein LOC108762480 [Trachymyrmex cornetzi]